MTGRSIMLAGAATLGVAASALAAPIAPGSQITLAGYVQAIGAVSLDAATGLDFVSGANGSSNLGSPGSITSYGAGSGSFVGLACSGGSCGSVQDIPSLTIGAHAISGFVSLAGGSTGPIVFDLASITQIDRLASGVLSFAASGTLHYGAFDPTAGSFTFSAQGNEILSFFGATIYSSYTGEAAATTPGFALLAPAGVATPEPASSALLGGGVVALIAVRRQRTRAATSPA